MRRRWPWAAGAALVALGHAAFAADALVLALALDGGAFLCFAAVAAPLLRRPRAGALALAALSPVALAALRELDAEYPAALALPPAPAGQHRVTIDAAERLAHRHSAETDVLGHRLPAEGYRGRPAWP